MKVFYSRQAEKEILALETTLAQKIAQKIAVLESTPFPHGYEKLGSNKGYRIRIGDYRVVYIIDKVSKEITVIKVKHRREVYR